VQRGNPTLPPLCTAFQTNPPDANLQFVLLEVLKNTSLMAAFRDLAEALEVPGRYRINCARAIETLSQIVSPGERSDRKSWINLRQALNLSTSYLMGITEESKGPRHGSHFERQVLSDGEIQIRAWTVMNRFLEYRKRGAVPLPVSEFLPL
jgi:hypothetical protein